MPLLIRYPKEINPGTIIDEWELYDLEKDPDEMNNVYNDPEYADVRDKLHTKLMELREKYGDSDELSQEYLKAYLDARNKN